MGAILSRSSAATTESNPTTPSPPKSSSNKKRSQITNFSSRVSSGKAQSEPNRTSVRKKYPHHGDESKDLESMCAVKRTLSDLSSSPSSARPSQTSQNNNKDQLDNKRKHQHTLRMSLQIEIGSCSTPYQKEMSFTDQSVKSQDAASAEDSSNSDESCSSGSNLNQKEEPSSKWCNHNKEGDESSPSYTCDSDVDSIEEAYQSILKTSTLGKTANEILQKKTLNGAISINKPSKTTMSHKKRELSQKTITVSSQSVIKSVVTHRGVLKEQNLPDALKRRAETTGFHDDQSNLVVSHIQTHPKQSTKSENAVLSSSSSSTTFPSSSMTENHHHNSQPFSLSVSSTATNNNQLLLHNPASPFPLTPKSNQPLPVTAFIDNTFNDENNSGQVCVGSDTISKTLATSSLTTPNGIVLTPLRRRKQVFKEEVQIDVTAPLIQVLSPDEQQIAVQNKPHLKWAEQKKRNMIKNKSQSKLVCDGEMLGINKAQKKKVKIRTADDQEILLIK
ncbi:hypothetical protein FDP41_007948 [Naegleria fowleri]|uniref:Uncharacterized protein n=1 Tax=Naegleria fowleri TaxID=5763 RepID=A0A6A5C0R4_NAEFO|nr:uncharacterized protein FDP41_007948 [Naegleria fowleri]KAF0984033.1 hypothetical protein FDP41_007948 [Naegleria fowleri]